jgi:hypothetical protein
LPDNCALGVINLNITDGDSTNNNTPQQATANRIPKLHTFCAACKEGYKPTNINALYFYVKVQCTKIENCEGTQWFNACSKCASGYVYGSTGSTLDYTKCIPSQIPNCFAALEIAGICLTCMKGFVLNQDRICEPLTPPNCKSSQNYVKRLKYAPRVNLAYALYYGS